MKSKTRDTCNPLHRAQTTLLRDKEISSMRSLVSRYPREALAVIPTLYIAEELSERRSELNKLKEDVGCGKKDTDS